MSGAAGSGATNGGGAYVAMGDWHGYAFTSANGAGSTIMPMNFEARMPGQGLCASGTVGAAADYSGTALVGVNLNQPMGAGGPMPIMMSKAGVFVQVKNNASSTLRVQIQGPNGDKDAMDRWCAPLMGTSGFIPWSTFNTACWDNSGTAYSGQPIVAAMLLVPGGATDPVKFDFCIETLMAADAAPGGTGTTGSAPAAGTSGTATAGASGAPVAGTGGAGTGATTQPSGPLGPGMLSGSGMITDKYGAVMVMRDGRSYYVQNNVWGDTTTQTLSYNGTTFEVKTQTGSNMASGSSAMGPVSYPSTFIGSNFNRATTGSNLPKQVSALRSVKTGWSNNAGSGISGTYNAAYDVWFSTGSGGDMMAPSGGYLMVWYSKPNGAQPIGSADPTPVTIPGASGMWEVWLGQNNGKPCISYVRTQATDSLEFDLNAFIQHATTRGGAIQSSWYLSNVFAGFEIWSGGVGLKTTAFYAIVE
jgi:Glycosyl hydrolase family 12